ncbi:MAG: pyruvate kinase [Dehalococcoidales bacterium]|nr:MAG: pyruvate kinase [Dehalococcoidales bacterium]
MKPPRLYRRRTKIVCTIGPASRSAAVIEKLIRAGMNVARLNLSHGTFREHARYINTIRRVSKRLGINVSILIDLPGPKYRIGKLKDDQALLKKGSKVTLTARAAEGDSTLIPVVPPSFSHDVKAGDTILLDDGAMRLRIISKEDTEITCRVMVGGTLTSGRGLAVPGMRISGPFITENLKKHITFAIEEKPDYLAGSFIGSANDITSIRKILHDHDTDIPIIAKIERGEAVKNFKSILPVSDGIMVARGDLGVDIPLEKVPLVQKEIIKECNRAGKPVITATQMLESMLDSARPTRAEATDVANSIFDGTDAMMLSGETAIGNYPVQAVTTMAKIAAETESKMPHGKLMTERAEWLERKTDELISYSACHIAYTLGAKAVVALTQSGSTASRVSKYRPDMPVLALTTNSAVLGRLVLYWGVYPFLMNVVSSVDELFAKGAELARDTGIARTGDLIVITGGIPVGIAGSTNLLKVEKIL